MREKGHKPKQGWIRPPAAPPGPNYLMDVAPGKHLKRHSRQNKGKKSKLGLLTPFIGYVFHPSSPSTDVVSSSTTEMGRRDTRAQIIINLSTHKQANFHTGNLTQSQNRHWDIFRITNDLFFCNWCWAVNSGKPFRRLLDCCQQSVPSLTHPICSLTICFFFAGNWEDEIECGNVPSSFIHVLGKKRLLHT